MNNTDIVQNMIRFIEEKERQLQTDKLSNESQVKNDIVKAIMDELEKEVKNENQ